MRKSRFTEEQIAMALRQAEAGTTVREICRKLEVTEQTFYRWKRKYGGLGVPELRELRQLREENRRLWGSCHFLCVSEEVTTGHHSRWLKHQVPLLQSLSAPVLPDEAFRKVEVVETVLKSSSPEPGLSVCSALHQRGLAPSDFGLTAAKLPSQVANTLRELGVIRSPGRHRPFPLACRSSPWLGPRAGSEALPDPPRP